MSQTTKSFLAGVSGGVLVLLLAVSGGFMQARANDPGVGQGGPVQQVGMAAAPIASTDPGGGICNSGGTLNATLGICNPVAETITDSAATPIALTASPPITINMPGAASSDILSIKAVTCTAANNLFKLMNGATQEFALTCAGNVTSGSSSAGSGSWILNPAGTFTFSTPNMPTTTDAIKFNQNGTCTAANNIVSFQNGGTNELAVTCNGQVLANLHMTQGAGCSGATPQTGRWACRVTLSSGGGTFTFSTAFTSTPVCTATDETSADALKAVPSTSNVVISNGTTTDIADIICVGNPN